MALTFVIGYGGTWSYSIPEYSDSFESFSISASVSGIVDDPFVLNQRTGLVFCSPNTAYPAADSCSTDAFGSSGKFSGTFTSSIVDTTAGATLNPEIEFDTAIGGVYWEGSVTADFLDPATLTFLATNPTTGGLLPGVTITGDSGTIYSVNPVSGAPEPKTLGLALATIFLICLRTAVRTKT